MDVQALERHHHGPGHVMSIITAGRSRDLKPGTHLACSSTQSYTTGWPCTLKPGAPLAGSSEWIYTAVLTLEDATAELDGRLIGADGERFFQGMPPVNLQVC